MHFHSSTYALGNTKGSATWAFSVTGPEESQFTVTVTLNDNAPVKVPISAPAPGGASSVAIPDNLSMTGTFRLTNSRGRYWLVMEGANGQGVIVWAPQAGLTGGPFIIATWEAV